MSESGIQNLKTFDPFADADEPDQVQAQGQGSSNVNSDKVHIRIQQRNGRKTLTTVQGIPVKYDAKLILKVIKKKFACNGTIVKDDNARDVIQVQGDQRKVIADFLVADPDHPKDYGLGLNRNKIEIHGA